MSEAQRASAAADGVGSARRQVAERMMSKFLFAIALPEAAHDPGLVKLRKVLSEDGIAASARDGAGRSLLHFAVAQQLPLPAMELLLQVFYSPSLLSACARHVAHATNYLVRVCEDEKRCL